MIKEKGLCPKCKTYNENLLIPIEVYRRYNFKTRQNYLESKLKLTCDKCGYKWIERWDLGIISRK